MAKRIICIGDSNTWGYDPRSFGGGRYPESVRWTSLLGDVWQVENLGENGREIPVSDFAVRVLLGQISARLPADGLCVMLGTNDLLGGTSPAETARRMEGFLDRLRDCDLPLLLVAPPLMQRGAWVESETLLENARALAPLYRELAERCGAFFCDTAAWDIPVVFDGVHFSEDGHRRFAEQMQHVFQTVFH